MQNIRILGIDPGTLHTGYGVIDWRNKQANFVDCGTIHPSPKESMPERLAYIFQNLQKIVAEFQPDCMVVEQVFVMVNVQSALKLGQARGVALCVAALAGVTVHEYLPTAVKKSIVGHGRADKAQIQYMIRLLLNLPEAPDADAADALALALCHTHMQQTLTAQQHQAQQSASLSSPPSLITLPSKRSGRRWRL